MLQIIDDGLLTEGKGGRRVSFSETIIIMTSNIGIKEVEAVGSTVGFGDVAIQTEEKTAKARGEALKRKFKPEFLNRVDEIVHFRKLEKSDFMHILDILLGETSSQANKSRGITIKINPGAKNFLLDKGIDSKFGARPLRRAIKKYLSTPLARAILKAEVVEKNGKITVSVNSSRDGLSFRDNGVKKDD